MPKLEALQAAWGLLATGFRQRCRRKRVFNVLEGSNVGFYFYFTQVSAVGLITLPSFFAPIVFREVHVEPLVELGERKRGGGRGARTTEHRRQLKHLHQTTARTPLETDVKFGIRTLTYRFNIICIKDTPRTLGCPRLQRFSRTLSVRNMVERCCHVFLFLSAHGGYSVGCRRHRRPKVGDGR